MEQLLLLGSRLLRRETRISPSSKLVLELLNPARRVDELQLARVKRMANIANVDLQLFTRASSRKTVTATAGYFGLEVIWMNAVFHDQFPRLWRCSKCNVGRKAQFPKTATAQAQQSNSLRIAIQAGKL
jgi:hypothetical protein